MNRAARAGSGPRAASLAHAATIAFGVLVLVTACLSSPQPESCTDGRKNGAETGRDCGGMCVPCELGAGCKTPRDCLSLVCTNEVCSLPASPTCSDGVHNGVETDVDCGGGCAPCSDGKTCAAFGDCLSVVCSDARCTPPSCTDNAKNGSETDTDCGGACFPCDDGKTCAVGGDCQSMVCAPGIARCVAPTCEDGIENGGETDTDCGGSCDPCRNGKSCSAGTDCQSLVCNPASATCAAPMCADGVKNGRETDLDCGGGCARCANNKACLEATDCDSGICLNTRCAIPSCSDGLRNGNEIDVDCGGACAACAAGKTCRAASDCQSSVCANGLCAAATCNDGARNNDETDVDCGGACGKCGDGKVCRGDDDCASAMCGSVQRCSAITAPVHQPETAVSRRPSVLDASGTLHTIVAVGNTLVHVRKVGTAYSQQPAATVNAPELLFHPFFTGAGAAMYRVAIDSAGRIFLLYTTNRGPAARDADQIYLTSYTAGGGWKTPVNLRTAGLWPTTAAEYHEGIDLAIDSQDNVHVVAAFFPYGGKGHLEHHRYDPTFTARTSTTRLRDDWSGRPTLVIDEDDHLHLVNDGYYAGSAIHYRTSADRGATWSTPVQVSSRTSTADSSIGLAVTDQGGAKTRFVSRRNPSKQIEVFSSSDGATFTSVFTTNEPNLEHEGSMLLPIGGDLQVFFVGPTSVGGRSRLARVIKSTAGFAAPMRVEDSPTFSTDHYGLAGSTWPAFNRPTSAQVTKHWTTPGSTMPNAFLLINRL